MIDINNKKTNEVSIIDEDMITLGNSTMINEGEEIVENNKHNKERNKSTLLNFEDNNNTRNIEPAAIEPIQNEDWWTLEGVDYEEAKLFDKQFYLPRIRTNEDEIQIHSWINSTWARMIWLTITLLGLQFTWSLELSYGTPYLLSLDLSKSMVSLVWLAGPMSGLIMQPLIGAISDRCESPLGRRRPFLIIGTGFVLFSLISIGWTEELVNFLNGPQESIKYIAVLAFWILDFAVNTIQAASRALIVDVLPSKFQETGNAWAGRMIGVGNVIGYFMGYLDLVSILPFLGNKQLKVLSFLACLLIIITVGLTCGMVREVQYVKPDVIEPPLSEVAERETAHEFTGLFKAIKDIFQNIKHLPLPIWKLCIVQFYSWIGWFPFLFYSTTWVAEFITETSTNTVDDIGVKARVGSRAFVIYSLVSLFSSFILPYFCKSISNDTKISKVIKFLPTLPQMFSFSLCLFGILMISAGFIGSVIGATLVIALCGISWSISMWAPFALIGEFVHQKKELNQNIEYLPLHEIDSQNHVITQTQSNQSNDTGSNDPAPEAGMLLGIHNIFIVIPQFLTSLITSIIFGIFGPDTSVGKIMLLGGIASFIACYLSLKLWK